MTKLRNNYLFFNLLIISTLLLLRAVLKNNLFLISNNLETCFKPTKIIIDALATHSIKSIKFHTKHPVVVSVRKRLKLVGNKWT